MLKSRNEHLPSLTGMRWFAALLVFGLHVHVVRYFDGDGAGQPVRWLFGAGATGVSFFFILSGFVLAWSARDGDGPVSFWRRRLARVYPVHVVTAGAALLLAFQLVPGLVPSAEAATANLLLVHSWVPVPAYDQSLNPVSWSLACEVFFYLAFPLLYRLTRRLSPGWLWTTAAAATVVVVTAPLFLEPRVVYFFPPVRLAEFALGVALARLVRLGAWRGVGYPVALAVTAVGYATSAVFTPGPFRHAACTVVGFGLLIVAGAVADVDGKRSLARHPLVVRLGELSFAFYMVHILVIRTGEYVWARHPQLGVFPALGMTALAGGVSLGLSWLLHEWVERPGRRWMLRGA
ncbi:acyltransferase [Phytomonospora sp. NPDC050363]|uniref:acyltransferase family protein n=1 Tax=Phytomonospora sp. NPDC050363 TaxID=3155642 RepID=UPI0033D1D46D